MAEVTMPQLGETVTEGTITRWFKQVGDTVAEDEVLFEVSTDKVDSEVPSPIAGVLTEILVPEGDTVEVGRPIAVVSADGAAPAPAAGARRGGPRSRAGPCAGGRTRAAPPAPAAPAAPPAARRPLLRHPRRRPPPPAPASVRAPPTAWCSRPSCGGCMSDHGLTPSDVAGTGVGGRITRGDVERAIQSRGPSAAAGGGRRAGRAGGIRRGDLAPLGRTRDRGAAVEDPAPHRRAHGGLQGDLAAHVHRRRGRLRGHRPGPDRPPQPVQGRRGLQPHLPARSSPGP